MSKEKEIKQHLQQYDKDTLIELYLQKDFDTKQQLAEKDKEIAELKEILKQALGFLEYKENQESAFEVWIKWYKGE